MPLYEYHCNDCDSQFEELQPMNAPKQGAECATCSGTNTHRVLSVFAKGSGAQSEPRFACGANGTPPCGARNPSCLAH